MRLFADAKRGARIEANSWINAEAAEAGERCREEIFNHGPAATVREHGGWHG
jgi:hypothetical protein